MKIHELFKRLSLGALSNLSLTNDGSGEINVNKHAQIIQYTNESLLRLYSRFCLLEKDVLIEMVGHITHYHLRPEFAETTDNPDRRLYIKDLAGEPFTGDVIKILEVYNSYGQKMPLNDTDLKDSLFTPQHDILQVPNPTHGVGLGVHYQARHPVLRDDGREYINQDILLPFSLEGALIKHIAYQVYNDMNGQENIIKGQEYLGSYDAICAEVADRDLAHQSISTSHHKLHTRGFV
jgi:hypothetical protein